MGITETKCNIKMADSCVPSKPICHDFGLKELEKFRQKGTFLVHSAISKPKIDGFGARPL